MNHSLLLLVGFPGSGKSTIGKAIAAELKAVYLDKDNICNGFTGRLLEMNGELPDSRDSSEFYQQQIMHLEYETLFKVANDNLIFNEFVLIDAPFISYFNDAQFIARQKEKYCWPDMNVIVLNVSADLETTKQRLIQRGEKRDLWKLENWEVFTSNMKKRVCQWEHTHKISFDNSQAEANISGLVSQIRQLHN